MTYKKLKYELTNLQKAHPQISCQGFSESLDFVHFKTFFELKDEPQYTILQSKNNPEYKTTEGMWYLAYVKDAQIIVIDIADEETICDEYFQLMIAWFQGAQKIKTQSK